MSPTSNPNASKGDDYQELTPLTSVSTGNTEARRGPGQDNGDKAPVWAGRIAAAGMVLGIAAAIIGPPLFDFLGFGRERLEIVTSAQRTDSVWQLSGRVSLDGEGVSARVWAVAADDQGNRFSPRAERADSVGQFRLDGIPVRLASDTLHSTTDVTVSARARIPRGTDTVDARGEEQLRVRRTSGVRRVQLPPLALPSIIAIFLLSIILALIQSQPGGIVRRVQYFGAVILAFVLTIAVVVYLSLGLRHVTVTATPQDVVSLGFANIYNGTYVKDLPPEWLFSLTAPGQTWQPGGLAQGFGAPLWVLLIAVVGSGIFTVSLLVKHISQPVAFGEEAEFRKRLEEVVRHQFYILFAPVGAVFVYQLLVVAGAASEQASVALAMLAAGAALNLLLDKALNVVQKALQ